MCRGQRGVGEVDGEEDGGSSYKCCVAFATRERGKKGMVLPLGDERV